MMKLYLCLMLLIFILSELFIVSFAKNIHYSRRTQNYQNATVLQHPYAVSVQALFLYDPFDYGYLHICTGSIIGPRYVLTTAQCAVALPLRIRAGITNLNSSESEGQNLHVIRAFSHPAYNEVIDGNFSTQEFLPHNIAVLRLFERLLFTDTVRPIALQTGNKTPSGNAVIVRWSQSRNLDYYAPNQMLSRTIDIVNSKECKKLIIADQGEIGNIVDDSIFCSINLNNESCDGDRGGPVIQDNTLIGVAFGLAQECGEDKKPSIYGRVDSHIKWIHDQMVIE